MLALVQGNAAKEQAAQPPQKLSRREIRLVISWSWLTMHGKTPADLGMDWRDVDPGWRPAMMILTSAYEDEKRRRQASSVKLPGAA